MYSVLYRHFRKCTRYILINFGYNRRDVISAYLVHRRCKHAVNPWSGDNSGSGEVQVAVGDEYVPLTLAWQSYIEHYIFVCTDDVPLL